MRKKHIASRIWKKATFSTVKFFNASFRFSPSSRGMVAELRTLTVDHSFRNHWPWPCRQGLISSNVDTPFRIRRSRQTSARCLHCRDFFYFNDFSSVNSGEKRSSLCKHRGAWRFPWRDSFFRWIGIAWFAAVISSCIHLKASTQLYKEYHTRVSSHSHSSSTNKTTSTTDCIQPTYGQISINHGR